MKRKRKKYYITKIKRIKNLKRNSNFHSSNNTTEKDLISDSHNRYSLYLLNKLNETKSK